MAHRKTSKLEGQGREDCSIQAVLARMLKESMKQLWPREKLESLRARAGRIAPFRLSWPGC